MRKSCCLTSLYKANLCHATQGLKEWLLLTKDCICIQQYLLLKLSNDDAELQWKGEAKCCYDHYASLQDAYDLATLCGHITCNACLPTAYVATQVEQKPSKQGLVDRQSRQLASMRLVG